MAEIAALCAFPPRRDAFVAVNRALLYDWQLSPAEWRTTPNATGRTITQLTVAHAHSYPLYYCDLVTAYCRYLVFHRNVGWCSLPAGPHYREIGN